MLGLADTIIHMREEGPTVQLCGDSEVAGKWINGQYSLGLMYKGKKGRNDGCCVLSGILDLVFNKCLGIQNEY